MLLDSHISDGTWTPLIADMLYIIIQMLYKWFQQCFIWNSHIMIHIMNHSDVTSDSG